MVVNWGQAKIEFIALRDEIFGEHQKGKSRNRIYLDLRSAGRITMSQRSFYVWFDSLSSQPASVLTAPPKKQSASTQHHVAPAQHPPASDDTEQSTHLSSGGRDDVLRITGEIAPSKPTHELI